MKKDRVGALSILMTGLLGLVPSLWAADVCWQERLEIANQMPVGQLFWRGKVWAMLNRPNVEGLICWDGRRVLEAAKTPFPTMGLLYGTREGLWFGGGEQVATLQLDDVQNGAYTVGEPVVQPANGASGYVVQNSPQGLRVAVKYGSFSASDGSAAGWLRGVQSGCTGWVASAAAPLRSTVLFYSRDGFEKFLPAQVFFGQQFARQLVECPLVDGTNDARVLLWPESSLDSNRPGAVWARMEGAAAGEWFKLMDVSPGAIQHFHGGVCLTNTPNLKPLLALFAGDGNLESGLLICDDIPDLLAHPDDWKKHWGLDLAGAARTNWLGSAEGRKFCLGIGQRFRAIDLVDSTDGRTGYWLPDSYGSNDHVVMEVDLATLESRCVGARAIGPGTYAGRMDDGNILFGTMSDYNIPDGYDGDEYMRLWLFSPPEGTLTELARRRRFDYRSPVGLSYFYPITLAPDGTDTVVWCENPVVNPSFEGSDLVGTPRSGSAAWFVTNSAPVNFLQNGSFVATTSLIPWRVIGGAWDIGPESGAAGGSILRVWPAGTADYCYVSQSLAADVVNQVRGGWVTLSVEARVDPRDPAKIPLYGEVSVAAPKGGRLGIYNTPLDRSDGWCVLETICFVPTNAAAMAVNLFARLPHQSPAGVYFRGARLVAGACRGLYRPTVPAPALTGISRKAGGVALEWADGGNRVYCVEWCDDLSKNQWTRMGVVTNVNGTVQDAIATGEALSPCRFYRIGVVP